MPDFLERFRSKIDKSGHCWLFKGAVANQYGHRKFFTGRGRPPEYAHRIAWELEHHTPIPKGKIVRHSCDVPNCVRPDHLILGTQRENVYDMLKRRRFRSGGRGLRGEANPQAKLSNDDVIAILACHKSGRFGYRRLARFFGVTPIAIKAIVVGKHWVHVIRRGPDGIERAALIGRVIPTLRTA